jgi:serine/threonine-protein kinase HipA
LFDTPRAPSIEIDPEQLHLFGLQMAGRVSVSGVQSKLALSLSNDRSTMRVVAGKTNYLLKPQTTEYPDLPQNEHLTMCIARLLGLQIPTLGLVELSNASTALVIRRFDRTNDGRRIPMEDFCQLAELPPAEKYSGSVELCAKIIRKYSSVPRLDLLQLFRVSLISWWLGNGDLHLKNLSMLTGENGPTLSPTYDLVNTSILIPNDTMALTLDGKRDRIKPENWLRIADVCNVPFDLVAKEVAKVIENGTAAVGLVRASELRPVLKLAYAEGLALRLTDIVRLHDASRAKATKAVTKKASPRPITRDSVNQIVTRLEATFEALKLPLEGTPLRSEIDDVEWLSNASASDIFSKSGAHEIDPERTRDCVLKLIRLDRVRKSLEHADRIPGFKNVLRHLRNLSSDDKRKQAWDHLFEVELAAQLQSPHWELEFRETDLVIRDFSGRELGLECKRPRNSSTIARNVKEAIDQLNARMQMGIVVVNLDLVTKTNFVFRNDSSELQKECRRVLMEEVAAVREEVESLFDLKPRNGDDTIQIGVLFCATFLVGGKSPSTDSYINTRMESVILTPPGSNSEFLQFIADTLTVGQEALRARK